MTSPWTAEHSPTSRDLAAGDGTHLAGRYWSASGASATIVFSPGLGMTATDREVESLATAATGRGLALLSYDPRGHGASGGSYTMGHEERLDVAAALEIAARLSETRIVLAGMSTGAVATLSLAASLKDSPHADRVAGIIIVSCPSRWHRPHGLRAFGGAFLTRTSAGRLLAGRAMNIHLERKWPLPEPPMALVTRISAPVCVIHGLKDPYLHVTEGIELYDKLREPRRLYIPPDLGHSLAAPAREALVSGALWMQEMGDG